MKRPSKAYWAARAEKRMYGYMQEAERTASEIAAAYAESSKYIDGEITKITRAFQGVTGVSDAEAKRLLSAAEGMDVVTRLKTVVGGVSDPEVRKKLIARINAPAYSARIGRLAQLQKDIDLQCKALYSTEVRANTSHYRRLCREAYSRTMYDIQRGTGMGFGFAKMSGKRTDEILMQPWSGEHYSSRIWDNTQELADKLKCEILTGVLTGRAADVTALNIATRFGSSAFEARRLVRTDSAYIAGQAEKDSYTECGIEEYEFLATLDNKTSPRCRELDGKSFRLQDAVPGINYPPLHPWCRSTTVAAFGDEVYADMRRRARDKNGRPILVPANTTYSQWGKMAEGW